MNQGRERVNKVVKRRIKKKEKKKKAATAEAELSAVAMEITKIISVLSFFLLFCIS